LRRRKRGWPQISGQECIDKRANGTRSNTDDADDKDEDCRDYLARVRGRTLMRARCSADLESTHTNDRGKRQWSIAGGARPIATLEVAIETHAATAADAAGSHGSSGAKSARCRARKLGAKGMIWTGGYSLYPEYNEPRNGGKPTITGYRAENSITIEAGCADLVGPANRCGDCSRRQSRQLARLQLARK